MLNKQEICKVLALYPPPPPKAFCALKLPAVNWHSNTYLQWKSPWFEKSTSLTKNFFLNERKNSVFCVNKITHVVGTSHNDRENLQFCCFEIIFTVQ